MTIGSSPLARGLQPNRATTFFYFRIIPARAGFTRQGLPGFLWSGDHPRSRGVYAAITYRKAR